MAYKVRLPADFGRKHIGCPAHGNLTIWLKDGQDTKANSIILSLNSPVIDDLTTDLLQTTLQMDDFSRAAVDSFIEACYTGEVQLNKDLFRDLNKIAHVFKVDWLIEKCFEYFNDMIVQQIRKNDYEETCFALEEAFYVNKTLEKRNFFDLIIHQINFLNGESGWFVTKYLHNLQSRSIEQLMLVVKLAGRNTQLLAAALLSTLREDGAVLDDNCRYLLKSINFSVLREKHRAVYNELFLLLPNIENITMEDLMMIVRLQTVETPTTNEEQVQVAPNKNIPNMNCSIKLAEFLKLPFDEFVQKLIDSPGVKNLYMLIDGVWLWLYDNQNDKTILTSTNSKEELLAKIASVMTYRGWKPVTMKYLNIWRSAKSNIYTGVCNNFIDALKACKFNLVVEEGDVILVHRKKFICNESLDAIEKIGIILVPGAKMKFHFRHPSTTHCTKEGKCGFMLNVTRGDSGSLGIQLSTDPDEYPDDLHFHENLIFARNMHLAIMGNNGTILPLSCGEQLECDITGNYWRWGWIRFHRRVDETKAKWKRELWRRTCCFIGEFYLTVVYHE